MKNHSALGFVVSVLFLSVSAQAAPSKILGAWLSDCQPEETSSTQTEMIFTADGKVTQVETIYDDVACKTGGTVESSNGTYVVRSDSGSKTLVTLIPDEQAEGIPLEMKVEFRYTGQKVAQVHLISLTVEENGQRTEIPASELGDVDPVRFSKR